MSRPQKIIPPIKGTFNEILKSVAAGKGIKTKNDKEKLRNKKKDYGK